MINYKQLKKWEIPEDTFIYILKNNLCPLIEKIVMMISPLAKDSPLESPGGNYQWGGDQEKKME